ncbi:hypothetical protein TWF481_007236 [Arthrobotrys musiformis]|uniref:DnaJ homologue subfamily C member 28 conserved domain-containing protein n=1 Tax=Arthrobotrys musiformis TaxID=47236 RepID=A0AAV9WC89_9PEZI
MNPTSISPKLSRYLTSKKVTGPHYILLGARAVDGAPASTIFSKSFRRNISYIHPRFQDPPGAGKSQTPTRQDEIDEEDGAMRRRLEDLEEQSKLANPRRHIKEIQAQEPSEVSTPHSGSEGLEALKERLSKKIQSADFESEHAGSIAYARLSDAAGKETRETAMARPWTGTESLEDSVLRSLHEATPRLRGKATAQTSRTSLPTNLAPMRRMSKNERIVSARDRAGQYPLMKKAESELNDEEKEARSRMFKERFEPGARAMPNTIQGLTALANEKIEEAISKGMFKNLPKGPINEDHHAGSPFIDTTEYLLNRMIQRQEIVPPWIEKQQELQKEIRSFRGRIRTDWKRHVVRTIASWGGTPDVWIRRAEEYAKAEKIANPNPVIAYNEGAKPKDVVGHVKENASPPDGPMAQPPSKDSTEPAKPERPLAPFRDSNWEKSELSYHEVSIKTINNMTRSYNLQAPSIAQRPFLTLKREILACYRDVMPTIPAEMIERANNPDYGKSQLQLGELKTDKEDKNILSLLSAGEKGKVYDESEAKAYGFKQFWKDLFSGA